MLVALLLGAVGWCLSPVYGVVMALAMLTHVLIDQMGHMGSNFFFPFTRRRVAGFKLFHSGDPMPNFLAVWFGVLTILLNMDRFSTDPILPIGPYLLSAGLLPIFLVAWRMWQRWR